MYGLIRPLLFGLDAERSHDLTLRALCMAPWLGSLSSRVPSLPTTLAGLSLRNPVGLAAGLDKNGIAIDAFFKMGFGFVEIGTVTPRPQLGNPQPRLFRLKEHEAIINRFGFNNLGVDALCANVDRAKHRLGALGINIGKNKDTDNDHAIDDYRFCLERVHSRADYITVNISSPNTAGLRALQEAASLYALLASLRETQLKLSSSRRVPMFVKIAPDLNEADIEAIAKVLEQDVVDGVIATNTTLERAAVAGHVHAEEVGGLSGAPLINRANEVVRELRLALGDAFPIIGAGGITSGADAASKITAGANAVQLYSGLIYRGPSLVRDSVAAIAKLKQ